MENNQKTIEVLNDLIRINNDRIEGYEKAIRETNESDVDLHSVFSKMADESRQYRTELSEEVRRLGGDPSSSTTGQGKIYRVWMDIKTAFSTKERQSVLELCEYGEDAAQKAYQEALEEKELPSDIRSLVQHEKESLRSSHDTIKNYRDLQRSANKK